MGLKEAIDYLRPIMESARLDGYHLALRAVLESAEKDIAKVPEDMSEICDFENSIRFFSGRCPNCQLYVTDEDDHCADCGQKLDWSEKE